MTYSWDRAQLSCPRVKSLAHGPNSDTLKTLGFELKIFWWVVHFIRCAGSWYIPHCTSLTVRGTVQLDNKKKKKNSFQECTRFKSNFHTRPDVPNSQNLQFHYCKSLQLWKHPQFLPPIAFICRNSTPMRSLVPPAGRRPTQQAMISP